MRIATSTTCPPSLSSPTRTLYSLKYYDKSTLTRSRLSMGIGILFVSIPPCNVTRSRTAHATATVENNFLVKFWLWEAILFLEFGSIHIQRPRKAREWEINCRGYHALQYLVRFPHIDQIGILCEFEHRWSKREEKYALRSVVETCVSLPRM